MWQRIRCGFISIDDALDLFDGECLPGDKMRLTNSAADFACSVTGIKPFGLVVFRRNDKSAISTPGRRWGKGTESAGFRGADARRSPAKHVKNDKSATAKPGRRNRKGIASAGLCYQRCRRPALTLEARKKR